MPTKTTHASRSTSSPRELRSLVNELKKENARLHVKVARLETQLISARNRITALEKAGAATPLSPRDAQARIAQLERELGIKKP
jgi:predicted RNase H-like nuclease (RuvC/YqgF family)